MFETWTELARAATPDGDELILRRRGGEFDIRFNGWELMASRTSRSEEALARLVCGELPRPPRNILIGGLGMGYTLRATLDLAPPTARIVVAELVPAIVEWARGPLADLAGHPLDDRRVELRIGGVAEALAASRQAFDAILLDTDNGPEAVLREANGFLYSREGLDLAIRAVAFDGAIGFWSADRSVGFENVLDAAGLQWRSVVVEARSGGPEHAIYLARPPGLRHRERSEAIHS
jgi:spermidine synthase